MNTDITNNPKSIFSILQELENVSSRKKKLEILCKHRDNALLERIFFLALHPDITFGIQQVSWVTKAKSEKTLQEAIDFLEFKLATRLVTGNQARNQCQDLLESLSAENQDIVLSILDRNMRCGVSTATVNSVWPNLIPEVKFMLASSEKSDLRSLQFPDVIAQRKEDGMRVQVSLTETGTVVLTTRNNSKIECPKHLAIEISHILQPTEFLDGELVCMSPTNQHLPRQIGNGILNKVIHGTCNEVEKVTIHFVVWDLVNPKNNRPYVERLSELQSRVEHSSSYIHLVEGVMVNSREELEKYFNDQLDLGFEGIVAKNLSALWQPKRSNDWIKFKEIKTADLKITKVIPGSGKYVGQMGALELASEDGLVKVSVGTGFSDVQRQLLNTPRIIGRIVEIAYNTKIRSPGKVDSLYLPRFVGFRVDKTEASNSTEL